jgi:anaerobic dimethyl sulfoxide reductase subunit B (iron-sulfur subunit)
MAQKGFYHDMTKCIQCKSCEVACKDKNNLEGGRTYRSVQAFEQNKLPDIEVHFVSMSCNHCEKPICVEKCPTGAMAKSDVDGIVTTDESKCIACRMCEKTCPYGAPTYLGDQANKMGKCDGCKHLIHVEGKPVCVQACLTRALDFGDLDDLKKKGRFNVKIKGIENPKLTVPSFVVKAKKHALEA